MSMYVSSVSYILCLEIRLKLAYDRYIYIILPTRHTPVSSLSLARVSWPESGCPDPGSARASIYTASPSALADAGTRTRPYKRPPATRQGYGATHTHTAIRHSRRAAPAELVDEHLGLVGGHASVRDGGREGGGGSSVAAGVAAGVAAASRAAASSSSAVHGARPEKHTSLTKKQTASGSSGRPPPSGLLLCGCEETCKNLDA